MHASHSYPHTTFLIALLVHIIILFLLLTLSTDQQHLLIPWQQENQSQDEQTRDYTLPTHAALTPGASNFGSPIIIVQPSPDDQKNHEPEKDISTESYQGTAHDEPSPDTQEDAQEHATHTQPEEETLIESAVKPEENSQGTHSTPPAANNQHTLSTKTHELQQEPLQQSDEPKKPAPVKKRIVRKKPIAKPNRTSDNTQANARQFTFNDLAQGFLQSISEGGQDLLKRDGDPNKRPDGKELKYLTYVQRLIWYMQNEWRIEQDKLNLNTADQLMLTIAITIVRDGTLQGIRIINPSGNNSFDSFLIKGIEAAAPYPNVPSFLQEDPFELVLSIRHQEETRPWKINLRSNPLLKMR